MSLLTKTPRPSNPRVAGHRSFYPRLFFQRGGATPTGRPISPALADPLTDHGDGYGHGPCRPVGLALDGDSSPIHWESHPVLVNATASEQAIELTFDVAVEDDPAPTAEQFTVNVENGDGTTGTVAVNSVVGERRGGDAGVWHRSWRRGRR